MFLAEDVGGASIASDPTLPQKVGVAPPTVGLSNEGRPAHRAMEPSNQEASGEARNRSHLKRVESGRGDCRASAVLVVIGFVSFVGRGLRVVGSSPTVVVWSRCDRTRREGTPARLYRIKTHRVQFLLGVCVCVSVGPICK